MLEVDQDIDVALPVRFQDPRQRRLPAQFEGGRRRGWDRRILGLYLPRHRQRGGGCLLDTNTWERASVAANGTNKRVRLVELALII